MAAHDHHRPCRGGCGELADECRCYRPNPWGSMRLDNGDCPTHDRLERNAHCTCPN